MLPTDNLFFSNQFPKSYRYRYRSEITDTDTDRNCFGINKDTVADTNPHPVPSPSSAGLFGLNAGISQGCCA